MALGLPLVNTIHPMREKKVVQTQRGMRDEDAGARGKYRMIYQM